MLKTARDPKTGGRKITFTLPAEHAGGTISVVGNFNDWTPGVTVLARRGASQSASVVVPADYIAVFRYLGEGGLWFDEPEASYVDAGASVLMPPAEKKPAARKAAAKPAEPKGADAEPVATTAPKAAAKRTTTTRPAAAKPAAKPTAETAPAAAKPARAPRKAAVKKPAE